MCFCCPPAISALFCLWFQSGCSKGTVAGALTFFPPEPPLYQFERHTEDGRVLSPDEEADEDGESTKENTKSDKKEGPIEIDETRGEIENKMKSPIEQLTDQATERRKRSQERNLRDAKDTASNITYKLLLDPRLQVPPHDANSIQAIKILSPRGVHVAAVIYRVPSGQQATTKTILVSHGNATDIGAMFAIQIVIAHALDANVVVYDYSGFGESGGVPDEAATYRDIDSVYDYVLENMCDGDRKRVVLYGQSVGSGPCCYLASRESVGGMILHSPFTSGMRVLTPSRYDISIPYVLVRLLLLSLLFSF